MKMRRGLCLRQIAFISICCTSLPFFPPLCRTTSSFVPPTTSRAYVTCNKVSKSHGGRHVLETTTSSKANHYQIINHDNQIDGACEVPISRAVFVSPAYPLDENGRPADVPRNRKLLSVSTPNQYSPAPGNRTEANMPNNINAKINLQTPHSGRKFRPTHPSATKQSSKFRSWCKSTFVSPFISNRRFTEGWYYRLTLPQYNESFVFIFSIEDAGRFIRSAERNEAPNMETRGKSPLSRIRKMFRSLKRKKVKSPLTLACMQLLGPQDTYLVQSHNDDTKFWGWKHTQGLGCTFEWKENRANDCEVAAMSPQEWREKVQSGFQVLPFHFQGRLDGHDGTMGGVKSNQGIRGAAEYDMTIRPVAGWGNYPPLLTGMDGVTSTSAEYGGEYYRQYSTAGWLASYPVFEPHWQITMAHARATGTLNWNGTLYEFNDAPFYAEKNWGGAFPTKWYWAQCNSFENYPDLAFTAGGGIRQLPFSFLPGKKTETLGMIGIHYNGTFYEIVPWTGEMEWKVRPWGRWEFRGRCTDKSGMQFEAEVVAFTEEDVPGVLLRAPTKDEGMQYFCRDSGFGHVTLSLWMLEWDEVVGDYVRKRDKQPIIDRARSNQCAVEVGGGPWWDVWSVSSKMSSPLKWMVRLPYRIRSTLRRMG
eukprot:CCRYP_013805-RC/>CCRYP_013805-RC protein AED:0.16 eAED:0.16 QI:478/1/1/1/0.6/0.33/6/866/645